MFVDMGMCVSDYWVEESDGVRKNDWQLCPRYFLKPSKHAKKLPTGLQFHEKQTRVVIDMSFLV
jgi:hypothetical protein